LNFERVLSLLPLLSAQHSSHPNDELNYCYYLIPTHGDRCGNVGESDLRRLHEEAITKVGAVTKRVDGRGE
jgi:hypothetical protein